MRVVSKILVISLTILASTEGARREDHQAGADSFASIPKPLLREIIVSHTDEKGILQLFRMKEDGADSRQLTHSQRGCRMPACSPSGEKLVYPLFQIAKGAVPRS